jgi:hypothetical protein
MISAGSQRSAHILEHVQVVPSGMVAGALPIAPAGLGVQELALVEMFKQLPNVDESFSGLAVAAAYRLVTIFVSLISLISLFSQAKFESAKKVTVTARTSGNQKFLIASPVFKFGVGVTSYDSYVATSIFVVVRSLLASLAATVQEFFSPRRSIGI